jgi:hypothetical protein
MKSLRAGFMGAFEARKDRFGVLFDAIYMQLGQSRPATSTLAAAALVSRGRRLPARTTRFPRR